MKRAEFLRRSYEPRGIQGYVMRTLVGLRFRNPVSHVPLQGGVRSYERLMTWNLAALRGTRADVAMDMYLEDMQQSGVRPQDAADFALTPSTLGGGAGSLATVLRTRG